MKSFAFTCQGESHKATDKPCQDYSYSSVEAGLSIAIVCDGHGGERYFRSDVGSRFCVEITAQAIRQFVNDVDENLFIGKSLTKRKAVSEMNASEKLGLTDYALRQLFGSIIATWEECIRRYTEEHPVTTEEIEKVPEKYIEKFRRGESLEKIYGCTLMAYVQTKRYWFAFHLGDGKCVSLVNREELWMEPVEWDDRCFLNKTTSICDSDALNEFRYSYCGDGTFPVAVFLGSDGMDDSFGPMENLVDFYMQVAKMLAKDNEYKAKQSIRETLPLLSKRGSQDDMSLAYVYNELLLPSLASRIVNFQIERLRNDIKSLEEELKSEDGNLSRLLNAVTQKDIINRNYAENKIKRLTQRLDLVLKKLEIRETEVITKQSNKLPYGRHCHVKNKRKVNKHSRFIKKHLRK